MPLVKSTGRAGPIWKLSSAGPGLDEIMENVMDRAGPGGEFCKFDAPGRAAFHCVEI